MDHINLIIASGTLERVSMRFRDDGMPICTGSLRVDELSPQGTIFRTFIPFEAYGKPAQTLGESQVGTLIWMQGKIFWRKYTTRTGEEKSGLAVLVSKSSVLVLADATTTTQE